MQEQLTPREQEVFDSLVKGLAPKEIGYSLNISYDTVIYHQKNLYRKMGVNSLQELLAKNIPVNKDASDFPDKNAAVFTGWFIKKDPNSKSFVARPTEEINGRDETCVIFSGTKSPETKDSGGTYACAIGQPDEPTLAAMRKMKAFSFKALGDGNDYLVTLPTIETLDDGDQYFYTFSTKENEAITVAVNVPDSLVRLGWSGREVAFIQENVLYLQFGVKNPGNYNLKVWDIKTYL